MVTTSASVPYVSPRMMAAKFILSKQKLGKILLKMLTIIR
jgi:hypothetical protein